MVSTYGGVTTSFHVVWTRSLERSGVSTEEIYLVVNFSLILLLIPNLKEYADLTQFYSFLLAEKAPTSARKFREGSTLNYLTQITCAQSIIPKRKNLKVFATMTTSW